MSPLILLISREGGLIMYDAEQFAYLVIGFGSVISIFAFIGIILADKDNNTLKHDDDYNKKILKSRKRKRCKNKQL